MTEGRPKRRDGVATREKLLEATLELLIDEGLASLSTARISRAAGIVQSGFYAHFDSLEACVLLAAQRSAERLRLPITEGLAVLREQGAGEYQPVLAQIERTLDQLQAQWRLVQLVLRYYREPSPLGRVYGALMEGLRADLTEHLLLIVEPPGERPKYALQAAYLADVLVSMTLGSLESLMRQPGLNRRRVAELLTRQTLEMGAQVFGWVELTDGQKPKAES